MVVLCVLWPRARSRGLREAKMETNDSILIIHRIVYGLDSTLSRGGGD